MPDTSDQSGTQPRSKKNKSDVPSVEKALDIIELLTDAPHGMTMNEITQALDRTMGEIYRITVYLVNRGYLHRDSAGDRYSLTLKLFELSHRFDPTAQLLQKSLPVMERISATTEQSCHLSTLTGSSVLVLASVPSPRPAGYSVRTGAMFPFLHTSSGSVIMAYQPDVAAEALLSGLPKAEQAGVRQRLEEIRGNGFETSPSTLVQGVTSISAPVFSRDGIVAALTSGVIQQADDALGLAEMKDAVVEGAKEISALLGGAVYLLET